MPTLHFPRTTTYRKLDHDSMVIVLNIDTDEEYLEGVPCYWDAVDKVARPIPANASDDVVAMYCGIAQGTNPVKYHGPINRMAFYIGDTIVRLFAHAGEALDHFVEVFAGDQPGVFTLADGGRVEKLGHVIIDSEESKEPRVTFEAEEVSILMRRSIFKTRSF